MNDDLLNKKVGEVNTQDNLNSPQLMFVEKNSFKLVKNTKGYNWEIKIVENDLEILKEKVKELDDYARENFSFNYGGKEDE